MTCEICGRSQETKPTKTGKPRTPKGWHGSICSHCWRDRYMLRAITIPVASPISGTWEELRAALSVMWRQTTAATNFIMTTLYARDVRRNGEDKMPPMQPQYLYPEIRAQWPDLTPQSVASLEQSITAKYRSKRYEVVWTGASALPTARYPQPFPVHNQSWSIGFDEGNRPILSIRIKDARWELRLHGGARYRRQLGAIRQMVAGVATRGEAAIYRAHDGEILVKLVAWLPKPAKKETSGVLFVRTGRDHLLRALDPGGERIWILNADHIRRWVSEYEKTLQRLREDHKAEQRPTPSFEAHQDTLVRKQRNRMDSAVKEAAAQLVGFARRRKLAILRYDDSEQGFVSTFPWFILRERIKTLCDEYGITFEHASAGDMPVEVSPLAEEKDQ